MAYEYRVFTADGWRSVGYIRRERAEQLARYLTGIVGVGHFVRRCVVGRAR